MCFWWIHKLQNPWRHRNHYYQLSRSARYYQNQIWSVISATYEKHFQVVLCLRWRPFCDFDEMVVRCHLLLISRCLLSLIATLYFLKRVKNHKLVAIGFVLIVLGWWKCLNLGPSPPNHGNVFQKHCSWLHLPTGQVLWPNDLRFNRYIQKCTLPFLLILIMTSRLWKLNWSCLKF